MPRGRADLPRPADRPSTYHERVAQRQDPTRLSARAQRDVALKPKVAYFAENFAVFGVRKVWRQMPKPKIYITLPQAISIWWRDSQPNASGRPGAVQTDLVTF